LESASSESSSVWAFPFVFFEPPLAFFLFLEDPPPPPPPPPALDAVPDSPPLLFVDGAFPPAVEVGVAA
jgi:hypothetical protein